MESNYADILEQSWDNIPKVKTLPDGSWLLRARNAAYLAAKSEDQKPRVLFFYQPKEPMSDVDESQLEALGAEYDPTSNQVVKTFWIESGRDWDMVRSHILLHGVELGGSIAEGLKNTKGAEIVAYLNTRVFTDATGESREENVPNNFAKAE